MVKAVVHCLISVNEKADLAFYDTPTTEFPRLSTKLSSSSKVHRFLAGALRSKITHQIVCPLYDVSSDLKWNYHFAEVAKTARKRLLCLSQLKRSGLGSNELVQFYRTCIRPITEYACPAFHDSLPVYLSRELEAVQKRAMRIIFSCFPYEEALVKAGLVTLSGRRQVRTDGQTFQKHFGKQRQ